MRFSQMITESREGQGSPATCRDTVEGAEATNWRENSSSRALKAQCVSLKVAMHSHPFSGLLCLVTIPPTLPGLSRHAVHLVLVCSVTPWSLLLIIKPEVKSPVAGEIQPPEHTLSPRLYFIGFLTRRRRHREVCPSPHVHTGNVVAGFAGAPGQARVFSALKVW